MFVTGAFRQSSSADGVQEVVGVCAATCLALARGNVADDEAGARVELRLHDVAELDEEAAYDAIWLPLPFMPRAIVPAAFAALARSLRPGGWLLPGLVDGREVQRRVVGVVRLFAGRRPLA